MVIKMGYENDGRPQCWNCIHCQYDDAAYDKFHRGSAFRCDALNQLCGTHHMDVPNECYCKGKHFVEKENDKQRDYDEACKKTVLKSD